MFQFANASPTLVLKQFTLNRQPAQAAAALEIVGRPSGLIGFLLSVLGIDTTTFLRVYTDRIEFRATSLFGDQTSVFPLDAITAVRGGHAKPLSYLIFAGILLVIGAPLLMIYIGIVFWLVALVLIVLYFFRQSLNLEVSVSGDTYTGLTFHRSVIENVRIDIDRVRVRVREARDLIYELVAIARSGV